MIWKRWYNFKFIIVWQNNWLNHKLMAASTLQTFSKTASKSIPKTGYCLKLTVDFDSLCCGRHEVSLQSDWLIISRIKQIQKLHKHNSESAF